MTPAERWLVWRYIATETEIPWLVVMALALLAAALL